MASIWEKAISILVGNLNSGHSCLITAVLQAAELIILECGGSTWLPRCFAIGVPGLCQREKLQMVATLFKYVMLSRGPKNQFNFFLQY